MLPNFNAKRSTALRLNGIESIRDVPSGFKLRDKHRNIQRSVQTAREIFSEDLSDALAPLEAPAFYLDFETFSPVEPIYPETSPRQRIPFQWSIHYEMTTSLAHEDGNEGLEHFEFLADGSEDPRRELAESMLDVLRDTDYPIIVYNQSFELGVIEDLAVLFPDITVELRSLKDRVQDLLPIVRDHLTHPALFTKSALKSSTYSIKNVLPVLASDLDYVDLEGVQDGGDATTKYEALVRREITGSDAEQLRSQLLRYCELDTYAMVRVRHALLDRAST